MKTYDASLIEVLTETDHHGVEAMKHDTIETRHERLRQVLGTIVAYGEDVDIAEEALRDDDISSEYLLDQYREGMKARQSGAAQVHNPYEFGTAEHESWHKGWWS